MRKDNTQYHYGVNLMIVLHSLPIIFYWCDARFDVYMFYDHTRYLTNILSDIAYMADSVILTYWLSKFKRSIFRPLFIVSVASVILYFTFYKQMASLILIPLYVWLVQRQKRL